MGAVYGSVLHVTGVDGDCCRLISANMSDFVDEKAKIDIWNYNDNYT